MMLHYFSRYLLPSLHQINARDLVVEVSTTVMYEGDASALTETTSASAETHVTYIQVIGSPSQLSFIAAVHLVDHCPPTGILRLG